MTDLDPLIRLRKHRVDEKQKGLADLYRQAEQVEMRKTALLDELERERLIMEESELPETRAYYGRFAEGINNSIAQIDKELAKLETRIQIARDDIREAFADLKRIEIVQRNRKHEAEEELKLKETKELDEIGLEVFRRSEKSE